MADTNAFITEFDKIEKASFTKEKLVSPIKEMVHENQKFKESFMI